MSICLNTGLPHVGEDCARCIELERCLVFARDHHLVTEAHARTDAAWLAYQAGKHLPDVQAHPLEAAWRSAVENERVAFAAACNEYTTTHQGASPRA